MDFGRRPAAPGEKLDEGKLMEEVNSDTNASE